MKTRLIFLATTLLVPATSAMAAVPQPPTDQASAPPIEGLEDIVVTAQRRAESVQKVPLAIVAVSSEALQNRHFTDPAQLQFVAPNLQVTSFALAPGATNFSVRGIGTANFSHLIEPSVATVIDGVVLGRPEMGVMQFSDLERVEVLSGPQGMLFGKNASAGLINIVTTKPKLNVTEIIAHAEVGVSDAATKCCTMLYQATANVPLSSNSALRINGYYSDYKQLVKNVNPNVGSNYGHQEYGFRPKFRWEPTDNLTINLAGDFAHGVGIGAGVTSARSTGPGSPLAPQIAAAGIVPSPTNTSEASNAFSYLTFDVGGVQGDVTYTFDNDISISNILAYRTYKERHSYDADHYQFSYFDVAYARPNFKQVTDELRLTSGSGGRLEYQAGLFIFLGQFNRSDYCDANLAMGTPPPGKINWGGFSSYDNLRTRSYAAYAQATYKLTDKARVTVGGRYTMDRLTYLAENLVTPWVYGFGTNLNIDAKNNANNFSWRVSGQYDFAPAVMGYVTVSTGYKGPGFNPAFSGSSAFGPEKSRAYEVGIKSRIGRSVQLNVSAYWEDVDHFQVQAFLPQLIAYVTTNAGQLRSRGVETEVKWSASRDLNFSANGSFNDAKFTSFPNAQCYPGQTAAQGCITVNGSPITNAAGNRLPNAPKWSGNLAMDYEPQVSEKLKLLVHADIYGRTKVNFAANANPFAAQKGYAISNGSVGIGSSNGAWRASIFCRNCFNTRYVTFVENHFAGNQFDYNQTFGLTSFRTVGLSLDVRM